MKRTPLSRELIVTEAYKMAESDTLGNLSLRGVARNLNVQPQTLYHYFPSLEDLKLAVAIQGRELLMRQLYANLVPVSGMDALRVFAMTIFQFAEAHPSFQEMLTRAFTGTNAALPITSIESADVRHVLLDILTPMIANQTERERTARAFLATLFGYAKLSINGFFKDVDVEEDFRNIVEFLIKAVAGQE
ncbi:TetR/AcrR family transcriptional regulator [Furfurilactobacillus entadae]|uniref:TetR/AcrR family transcriptional regulator n=1 Tax=Furfurilactobacillus entadae TaxID=2922307 RepID=UPI0035EAE28D